MILSGKFIAFLPELYAEPFVNDGQLKLLSGDDRFYSLGVAVAVKKRAQHPKAVTMFMDIIRSRHADAFSD